MKYIAKMRSLSGGAVWRTFSEDMRAMEANGDSCQTIFEYVVPRVEYSIPQLNKMG